MRRPFTLVAATVALLVGASACGASSEESTRTGGGGAPVEHPTEGDHLLIRYGLLYVAGDGKVYRPAQDRPNTDEHPDTEEIQEIQGVRRGPAAPALDIPPPDPPMPMTVAQLSTEGMEMLLAEADRLGLLDRSTKPSPELFDMVVAGYEIHLGERSAEHWLPVALDDAEGNPEMESAVAFARILRDIEGFVGDEIGPEVPYVPEWWVVRTGYSGFIGEHPIHPWPLDDDTELNGCVVLPSAPDVDTAAGGYETEKGRRLDAHPALPWDRC